MTAWANQRDAAISRIAGGPSGASGPAIEYAGWLDRENVVAAVDTTIDQLAEPDRDMISAGLAEIEQHAIRLGIGPDLVERIWRAMLDAARR